MSVSFSWANRGRASKPLRRFSRRRCPSKRSLRQRLHPRHQRPSPRPIVDRKSTTAYVLLEDGAWFPGIAPLTLEQAYAEVTFTTILSGYQEDFTNLSYLGLL